MELNLEKYEDKKKEERVIVDPSTKLSHNVENCVLLIIIRKLYYFNIFFSF